MVNFRQQSMRQSIQFQHSLGMAKTQSKIVKTKQSETTETPTEHVIEAKSEPTVEEEIKSIEQPKIEKQLKLTKLPNLGK